MQTVCGRCARLARQSRTESRAKSRDFRSKPARCRAKNARKPPHLTFQNCADATHHLHDLQCHVKRRGALAASVLRAKTMRKPTRTHAIFMQMFLNFSRGTHRTVKFLVQVTSKKCATTASDDCASFVIDARVWRAKIAPNRTEKHAIFDRNHQNFASKMRTNNRKTLSKATKRKIRIFTICHGKVFFKTGMIMSCHQCFRCDCFNILRLVFVTTVRSLMV